MLNFSRKNKHWPLAIDIGSDSIKMLQIQCNGSTASVCACGRYRIPASVEDPQQRRELTVKAAREMLRDGDFRGRRVVSALSWRQLNIKNVRLPQMPEHELRQAVQWEARERFDFDVENDQLNILDAGQIRTGVETWNEIIMLAASRETIEEHLGLLSEMGLTPERIEAEPVAVFRIFERFLRRRADENAVSVVVDIGAGATRVVVAKGRQIVFIKSIDIGGTDLTKAVAKRLNLSCAEANDLRMQVMTRDSETLHAPSDNEDGAQPANESARPPDPGQSGSIEWTVRDAVRAKIEAAAREVSLCLRYCSVTFRGLRPEQITLTGGEAHDPAVLDIFNEQLGIECLAGQPLRGIDLSAVDLGGDRRNMLNEWAVCGGLAISSHDVPFLVHESENVEHRFSA